LARALSFGTCCVVTDTAAYSEFPDDVVVKTSPYNPVQALKAALSSLIQMPEARAAISRKARDFSLTELSLDTYAEQLLTLCREARGRSSASESDLINAAVDRDKIAFGPFVAEDLDLYALQARLPAGFITHDVKVSPDTGNPQLYAVEFSGLSAQRSIKSRGCMND
jgi:hypothetical protein